MTDTVLRPRSATELVDAAVQLLRAHYKSFVMVSGIGMIPFLLLRPSLSRLVEADGASAQMSSLFSVLVMSIATSMWYSLAGAAIIAAAAQAYHEGRIDVAAAIDRVMGRIPAVLYTSFLKGLAIGFGAILFLVGAVYYYATYFSLPTTVVLEDLTGRQGEARARQLVEGNRWRVLKPMALVFFVYLCLGVAIEVISGMFFGTENSLATDMLAMAVKILVYPIIPITEMLVYYDLRIRAEGYDVEVMTSKLDGSASAPSA